MDKREEAPMASTDLYENFRGKTAICERVAGTASERTGMTQVQQSGDERVLETTQMVRHC